jgi:hypothetical protein
MFYALALAIALGLLPPDSTVDDLVDEWGASWGEDG